MLSTIQWRQQLKRYYVPYLSIARRLPVWGSKLGYELAALSEVDLMVELRNEFESITTPCVISVAIGPRGDGYRVGLLDASEAEEYHATQIAWAADSVADMVASLHADECGRSHWDCQSSKNICLPCAISFTLETDGNLITGRTLRDAIESVDAATGGSVAYFMLNCSHPTHFAGIFDEANWCNRILGIKANASKKSHAELNESETLDEGDPADLGQHYRVLTKISSVAAHHGRLLRHRPPPYRGHLRSLPLTLGRITAAKHPPGLDPEC